MKIRGDVDISMGSVPPSPPRNLSDMKMTDDSSLIQQRSSPFVPLLNVSSVSKLGSGSYEADEDEPPLSDIREIILTSRDRGSIFYHLSLFFHSSFYLKK